MNSYVQHVLDKLIAKNPGETEFHQAATEILESLSYVFDKNPDYEQSAVLEMLVEPERVIMFRVPWVDDSGKVQINKGYRVQFNSAIGPYKGGIRFHPSVNLSILKFLGFEQIFKNSLTGLQIGGGKGGSDFDPKGKTDREIMHFCQAFMAELYRHIGANTDVPAGDIGVGGREIGYLFGYYKKLANEHTGVLTGRGLSYGGSLVRKEATGFGLVYLVDEMLRCNGKTLEGKVAVVSGSGNVAIYAAQKLMDFGARVVAMSDSSGYIYHEKGIDLNLIKQIKEVERKRISEYVKVKQEAIFVPEFKEIWNIPCDVALPCATQNELDLRSAEILVSNGLIAAGEGANMPTSLEATEYFIASGVLFAPGKAANAGGVAVSALEMAQSSQRLFWGFEEVDSKLRSIMSSIFHKIDNAAREYGHPNNFVMGANIAAFVKVYESMKGLGIC
ncbi:MAG: NADP-specific glutamate dehydrogenase [Clostridia bacterium]|nr:NADP-specific glutamate dehydrogenase [Clostridia bacterium]